MCIICAKPSGVEMPPKAYLKNMWESNDDGAGLMWASNNKVHIKKGFMKYKEFSRFVEKLGKRYNLKEIPIVMHFRITTHGGTKPQNTHPFPVVKKINKLQALELCTDLGVAHNGCIKIDNPPEISDTMAYISKHLVNYRTKNGVFYKNKETLKKIEKEITSKMCFLDSRGKITFIGEFTKEDGIYYSNLSYLGYGRYYSYMDYGNSWYWGGYGYDSYSGKSINNYGSKTKNKQDYKYAWNDWEDLDEDSSYEKWKEEDTSLTSTYTTRELMEVEGYIYDQGELKEGIIFIDKNQKAYMYDFEDDVCIPVDGVVYTNAGIYPMFNETKATQMVVNEKAYEGKERRIL